MNTRFHHGKTNFKTAHKVGKFWSTYKGGPSEFLAATTLLGDKGPMLGGPALVYRRPPSRLRDETAAK
ncbi:MAG TPA: hypothetical protein DHV51_03915 [Opitutae bacterium]|nr:hypothetical protein [Opitutae bacterium]